MGKRQSGGAGPEQIAQGSSFRQARAAARIGGRDAQNLDADGLTLGVEIARDRV